MPLCCAVVHTMANMAEVVFRPIRPRATNVYVQKRINLTCLRQVIALH